MVKGNFRYIFFTIMPFLLKDMEVLKSQAYVCYVETVQSIQQLRCIFPHSILKTLDNTLFLDSSRGVILRPSNSGYYFFCPDCEKRFQKGEDHFTEKCLNRLAESYHAESTIDTSAPNIVGFSWLYYCLVSIAWKNLAIQFSVDYNRK